jgi:acetyl esterase/lipase
VSAGVQVSEHRYKTAGGVPLTLRVFQPSGGGPPERPAIVFFFGGGWRQGTVEQFVPQCRHLASGGMVALAADYRVRGRHGTTPLEAMADARSAIRWARTGHAELGIDPDRIAAAGGSAGGHIAACAALIPTPAEPGEDGGVRAEPDALVL